MLAQHISEFMCKGIIAGTQDYCGQPGVVIHDNRPLCSKHLENRSPQRCAIKGCKNTALYVYPLAVKGHRMAVCPSHVPLDEEGA